jgi:hypothetical protein
MRVKKVDALAGYGTDSLDCSVGHFEGGHGLLLLSCLLLPLAGKEGATAEKLTLGICTPSICG